MVHCSKQCVTVLSSAVYAPGSKSLNKVKHTPILNYVLQQNEVNKIHAVNIFYLHVMPVICFGNTTGAINKTDTI